MPVAAAPPDAPGSGWSHGASTTARGPDQPLPTPRDCSWSLGLQPLAARQAGGKAKQGWLSCAALQRDQLVNGKLSVSPLRCEVNLDIDLRLNGPWSTILMFKQLTGAFRRQLTMCRRAPAPGIPAWKDKLSMSTVDLEP